MSEPIDIGCDVTISFVEYKGERCGLIEEHPSSKSPTGRCSGFIAFRGTLYGDSTPPVWDVVSMEPLTLAPSLLCRTCGHHGFIVGGKWKPA